MSVPIYYTAHMYIMNTLIAHIVFHNIINNSWISSLITWSLHALCLSCMCSYHGHVMIMSTSYQNVEFLTLQHFTSELSIAISADLTKVAEKLFAKRVISQAQLEEALQLYREESKRASRLVTQALSQIRLDPEKFDVFLKVLEESDVSKKMLTDVHEKYEGNQNIEVNCDTQWIPSILTTCIIIVWSIVMTLYKVVHDDVPWDDMGWFVEVSWIRTLIFTWL